MLEIIVILMTVKPKLLTTFTVFTDRYGNFAVPVKMVFVNDNRCISDVFGWDFGLRFYQKFLLHVFASLTLFLFLFNFLSF